MKTRLLILVLLLCLSLQAEVLIYGDTRNHPEVHRQLVSTLKDREFDLIFFTGDMNRKGTAQSEYDEFHGIIGGLKGSFYPVRGNHERDLELYLANFILPGAKSYYRVEHDSICYIVLDSELGLLPGSDQYKWLIQELQESLLPRILLVHHPVFSSGPHGDELGLSLFLPAIAKKHGVKAIISGHEHSFEHLVNDGIHYIVSGGGGAPLRDMKARSPYSQFFLKTHHYSILTREAATVRLQTYDLSGQLIHQFVIDI